MVECITTFWCIAGYIPTQ